MRVYPNTIVGPIGLLADDYQTILKQG